MSNVLNRGIRDQKTNQNGMIPQQNQYSLPVIAQPSNNDFSRDFNNVGQGGPQARMMPAQQQHYGQQIYQGAQDYQRSYYSQVPQQVNPHNYGFPQHQPYGYNQMYQPQPQYQDPTVAYQPPVQQAEPMQPKQHVREKKILTIIDPTTQEKVVFPPAQEKPVPQEKPAAAAEVQDPAVFNERKTKAAREFMEQVKNELSNKESSKNTEAAHSHPAPAPVAVAPEPVPQFVAPIVQLQPQVPTPVHVPVPAPVEQPVVPHFESPKFVQQAQPAQLKSEQATPEKFDTTFDSPPPAVPAAPATPIETTPESKTLIKEDSKDETEPDDKFEEAPPAPRETPLQSEELYDVPEKTPEEIAKEEADKAAEEAEKRKLKEAELDAKLAELVTSDEVDIGNGVYGRDFMVTLRELEKSFKRTPCPLSTTELNDFGLDIKTMSRNEKKPNFTPNWVQPNKTRSSNPYRGRMTTDGTGRGGSRNDRGMHNKKAPIARQSIERVPRLTLPTSKDAWKPERQKPVDGSSEENAEKESIQTICRKVRALMNKITPTTKDDLIHEFIGYNVSSNDDQLSQVVEIIFDKAVEEPKFCALYAEVCKDQIDHEIKANNNKSMFRNKVLIRTQATFQDKTMESNEEKEAQIQNETDPAKKAVMEAEIRDEHVKFRRRKFGNMTFIAHLYRNQLLSTKIVQSCIYELLKTIVPKQDCQLESKDIDEESVQCALQLIETSGAVIDRATSVLLDQWFIKLEEAKSFCGNKIRFMIMNVIELRKNKWVPRKSVETGPKKIDEIHKEIRNEQIENEKARDSYDKRGGGIRTNSNSLRKQGPTSRNSIERNKSHQQPEQRRATAAASTRLTTSNVQPKNINLSQMDTLGTTSGKSKWHSGASGGGNTASFVAPEPTKNAWNRGNNDRKKSTVDERQSALAAAKEINAGQIAARRSTSQNSIADKHEEEELDEAQQASRSKIMNTINSDVKEVIAGDLSQKEMVDGIPDMVGKEKYAKPSLSVVYEMSVRAATEKGMKADQRSILARVLRQSITNKNEKQAFIDGVARFCKHAVEVELWQDSPNVWTNTGEILMNVSHISHDLLSELSEEAQTQRLPMADLESIFLAAKTSEKGKKFSLFVDMLKRLAEAEMKENNSQGADGVAWEFQELKFREGMEKDGLTEELEKTQTSVGKSLKAALQ